MFELWEILIGNWTITELFKLRWPFGGKIYVQKAVFRIRLPLMRIQIWIQRFRLKTDPDPGFWWPKIERNRQLNYNLPIPWHPERTSKLQKKPSAFKRDHPAIQNIKFLTFLSLFLVILALLDPDPDPKHWQKDVGRNSFMGSRNYNVLCSNSWKKTL